MAVKRKKYRTLCHLAPKGEGRREGTCGWEAPASMRAVLRKHDISSYKTQRKQGVGRTGRVTPFLCHLSHGELVDWAASQASPRRFQGSRDGSGAPIPPCHWFIVIGCCLGGDMRVYTVRCSSNITLSSPLFQPWFYASFFQVGSSPGSHHGGK